MQERDRSAKAMIYASELIGMLQDQIARRGGDFPVAIPAGDASHHEFASVVRFTTASMPVKEDGVIRLLFPRYETVDFIVIE